jgi:hypothetical protein
MKNSAKILAGILFSLAIMGIFMMDSCQSPGKKAQEKMMENALEQGSGKDSDVDIQGDKVKIESGDQKSEIDLAGKEWPNAIPADVPEFNYGSIHHTTYSEDSDVKGWGVFYEDVKLDAIDKYDTELKNKGFTTTKMTFPKGGTITGEKGNIIVSVIISEQMSQVGVQVRE